MSRPEQLVLITGTGTEVGKTWVSAAWLSRLDSRAARKPVQSFSPGERTDAEVLAAATGESPETVCPRHRWYAVPMAPPIAAEVLGQPSFSIAELVAELEWPGESVAVGLVEAVGGVRSPIAADGDSVALARALVPDRVVLVADAGLGTINVVRLSASALEGFALTVFLNRFDAADDLHRRNRDWLVNVDAFQVETAVDAL